MVDMYGSHSKHPSFSSTLLDAIYRSIDEAGNEEAMATCRRKKELHKCSSNMEDDVLIHTKEETAADLQRVSGILSTDLSDSDTFYGKRLKPIRVWGSISGQDKEKIKLVNRQENIQDGLISNNNSRAFKMYAGLKKVKKPISPGAARLAGFLNSLFSSTGKYSKNPTIINNPDISSSPISKSADSSTCSSASSFSRSCLSKTPSCRGKPNAGEKRSVRCSPISVILNQNPQSFGNKSSPKTNKNKNQKLEALKNSARNSIIPAPNIDEQMLLHAKELNKKAEEAARDLLRNYQKKMDCEFPFDFGKSHNFNQQELGEDSEDAASCASSDLFELENLGVERYELPVYETTRLPINGLRL